MAERDPALVLTKPSHPHDSAQLHVTGAARYADDLREIDGTLHLAFGQSTESSTTIL